jgi:hypothetical protein
MLIPWNAEHRSIPSPIRERLLLNGQIKPLGGRRRSLGLVFHPPSRDQAHLLDATHNNAHNF